MHEIAYHSTELKRTITKGKYFSLRFKNKCLADTGSIKKIHKAYTNVLTSITTCCYKQRASEVLQNQNHAGRVGRGRRREEEGLELI